MSLADKIELIDRNLLTDDRGWFLKVLHGKENNLKSELGEIYVTEAKPGGFRANHFHKLANEWFTVIKGKAEVVVEDLETKERKHFTLDGDKPQTLYCKVNVAHVFYNPVENIEPFILIAYADQAYNPEDTYPYDLIGKDGI